MCLEARFNSLGEYHLRAFSSVGQSTRLIRGMSSVRVRESPLFRSHRLVWSGHRVFIPATPVQIRLGVFYKRPWPNG